MLLDGGILDGAREAWRSGSQSEVEQTHLDGLTLGAALEAACWGVAASEPQLSALIQRWRGVSGALDTAVDGLEGRTIPVPSAHAAPEFELRRCPTAAELVDGLEWDYFLDRFRRSLVERLRMPRKNAWGLSGALGEMADNVVQHAGLGERPSAVVCYEVGATHFSFAVADIGRGVRQSLAENPAHATADDAVALQLAVLRGASRRGSDHGEGFAQLLNEVADMEGVWEFRSGGARLTVDGRGSGARTHTTANSPTLPGLQLSVIARPAMFLRS